MFVPDGLYALYHVNREGLKQSIDIFEQFGCGVLKFAKAKEIIPSFVQIRNQSVDGKQVVSLRSPGCGKYLAERNGISDRGRFTFSGDSIIPFEFIAPENQVVDRFEHNCGEMCGIFKVGIRCLTTTRGKNIVHPMIDYYQKSKGLFVLEKRFFLLYSLILHC